MAVAAASISSTSLMFHSTTSPVPVVGGTKLGVVASGCCGDAIGFTGGCGEDLTVGCGEDLMVGCGEDLMVGCAGDLMACGGDLGGGACVDDSDVRVEARWIACA